jgi:ElaB/YqjD/DUF883 family membrane-anchored ribosome-binding protein
MGKDTSELREEIDETRKRMSDTIDAIAYKADVPSRIGDRVESMMPVAGLVRKNPLGLLFGAAAIGFLMGTLLPRSRIEEESLGPVGNQLKELAKARVRKTISDAPLMATQAIIVAMSGGASRRTPTA